MLDIRQTFTYADWFSNLRDRAAKSRIDIRIRRLSLGNPGDVKPVGEGVSELRVDYGPGYRIYFIKRADLYVVLLAGGEKSSQASDVIKAKALARELYELKHGQDNYHPLGPCRAPQNQGRHGCLSRSGT